MSEIIKKFKEILKVSTDPIKLKFFVKNNKRSLSYWVNL